MLFAILPLLLAAVVLGIVLFVCIVIRVLTTSNIRKAVRQLSMDKGWGGSFDCVVTSIGADSADMQLYRSGNHMANIFVKDVETVEPDVKPGASVSVSV